MKRAILIAILAMIAYTLAGMWVLHVEMAHADWSYSTHIGPTLPHGPAIHVGRFYYHHNGHSASYGGGDTGELGQFLREVHRAKRTRCQVLHAEYIARHGITTPAPLRRYHGCDKWSRDAAYWRARHNEIHPHTETLPQFTVSALRNLFTF